MVRLRHVGLGSAVCLVLACGGGGTAPPPPPPPPPPAPVASVTVASSSAVLVPAASVQLAATPRDAAGNPLAGRTVTWNSSNPGIASVGSGSGLVTGVTTGAVTITATAEGVGGTAAITVKDGAIVGAAGGTVTAASGAVVLQIPAGAVSQPTQFTVEPLLNPPPDPRIGAAWDIGPSGTVFAQPVTLALKYDPATVRPIDAQTDLRLFTYDSALHKWVPTDLTGSADTVNHIVSGPIHHLSGLTTANARAPAYLTLAQAYGTLQGGPTTFYHGNRVFLDFHVFDSHDAATIGDKCTSASSNPAVMDELVVGCAASQNHFGPDPSLGGTFGLATGAGQADISIFVDGAALTPPARLTVLEPSISVSPSLPGLTVQSGQGGQVDAVLTIIKTGFDHIVSLTATVPPAAAGFISTLLSHNSIPEDCDDGSLTCPTPQVKLEQLRVMVSPSAPAGTTWLIPIVARSDNFGVQSDVSVGATATFTVTIGPSTGPSTSIQNLGGTDNPWPVVAGSTGGATFTGLPTTGNGFYPFSVTGNPTNPVSLVVTAPTWLRTQIVNLAESDLSAVGAGGVDLVDDLNRAQELYFGQLNNVPLEYQTVSQPFTVTFDQVRGSGSASSATGNYFVDLVPAGATDLLTLRAFDGLYLPPQSAGGSNLMAMKAGSHAAAKPTIFGPTLDLSLLKPPAILPFTVTGGSVGFTSAYVYRPSPAFDEHLFTGGGNFLIGNFPGSGGGPPFSAKVLAPADLPAGALQGMMVYVIDDAQNSERCAKQYFGSLDPISFVLGPPLSPVTVTDLHSPNYKRLRVTFAVQPEYDRAYEINVYVGSDPRPVIRIMTTKAFLHGASTVDLSIPDVPGLAPFVPNNATAVLVQVIAKGWSDPGGLFGPRPTDGGTQRCAIRFVNVP